VVAQTKKKQKKQLILLLIKNPWTEIDAKEIEKTQRLERAVKQLGAIHYRCMLGMWWAYKNQ